MCLAATYFIWGSSFLAIRVAVRDVPPLLMCATRFALAGILLYGYLRARGISAPTRTQWIAAANAALWMVVLENGLTAYAEQSLDSGLAAVAFASAPLWTALVAGLVERWPARWEATGLVLGFAGVALLNLRGSMPAHPLAAAAVFTAALCWGFGTILSRRLELPAGPMAAAAQMLVGAPVLLIAGLAAGERISAPPAFASIVSIIFLVLFSSLIAFSCYIYLVRHVRPLVAVSHAYVNPLVAVVVGGALGGERLSLSDLAAGGLTVVGVFFVLGGPRLVRDRMRRSALHPIPDVSVKGSPGRTPAGQGE